ncbi:2TM domain-containing protein [Pseudorhodoferax sp. Leaf267]|uniref:2TM domain-containing protein n=1 Tax=Pseudorhodoferax sp. Leaf267 TaxID=1736316 RepID=UPI0006FDF2D7|nr:2TM domain-containing protein [Pseudorhodoferax sp. Leaf267]KQP22402.1 hypothetical protein ASF43_00250 [Pseudorhodoferax sp. Leaf267]
MTATPLDTALDDLAHRRARRKLGWYIHAAVYVCVNLALLALSFANGRHWALFPLFGWGVGLMAHGLAVFAAAPGGALYERLVARERSRLAQQREPRRG